MALIGKHMRECVVTNLDVRQNYVMLWVQLNREMGLVIEDTLREVFTLKNSMRSKNIPELYSFMTEISDPSKIKRGRLCIIKTDIGHFFRVRVLRWNAKQKKFRIFYIDQGYTQDVPPETLRTVNIGGPFPNLELPDACTLFYVDGIDIPRNGGWKCELIAELASFVRYSTMQFYHVNKYDPKHDDPYKKYFIQVFYERKNLNVYVRRVALDIAKQQHEKVIEIKKFNAMRDRLAQAKEDLKNVKNL